MKLWKHNRIDGEWELAAAEIAARFWAYVATRAGSGEVANLDRELRAFVTGDEKDGGLASVFDEGPGFEAVYDAALASWPEPR